MLIQDVEPGNVFIWAEPVEEQLRLWFFKRETAPVIEDHTLVGLYGCVQFDVQAKSPLGRKLQAHKDILRPRFNNLGHQRIDHRRIYAKLKVTCEGNPAFLAMYFYRDLNHEPSRANSYLAEREARSKKEIEDGPGIPT